MNKPLLSMKSAVGILVIIAGVFLLLDTLNITQGIFRVWWPSFIIMAGFLTLINNIKSYTWGIILVVGGIALQLRALNLISVNIFELIWPVAVILIGISLVLNRTGRRQSQQDTRKDVNALLGGVNRVETSKNYTGDSISVYFGGADIDLRRAVIKKEATIIVDVVCGGIELKVPENITVKSDVACFIGGVDDSRRSVGEEGDSPVLHVTGNVAFGGIEIKS